MIMEELCTKLMERLELTSYGLFQHPKMQQSKWMPRLTKLLSKIFIFLFFSFFLFYQKSKNTSSFMLRFYFASLITKKAYLVVYSEDWFPFFGSTTSLNAFFVPTYLPFRARLLIFGTLRNH